MSYEVGTHIDLSYMNSSHQTADPAPLRESHLYEAGTRFSFIKMAHGLIVTKITEPPIVFRVAVGA